VSGASRSSRAAWAAGVVLAWLGTGALLAIWYSGRIRDWSVMTDELQYVKLAVSVADTHSPVPMIHGTSVALANQVYPLLLASLYGPLGSEDAFRAAHVLNAFLMASAVLPAYLLGRELLPRTWSAAAAVLSVALPWMALTGFLMSEVVAYPVFLWTCLAFHRAVVVPRTRRDLLAVAAIGLAILTRTQFAALALVLPSAILVEEVGQALAARGAGDRRDALASGARSALRGHRALWSLYALGALVAAVVVAAGSGDRLWGAYSVTVESGWILPSATWGSAARHLAVIGIGCGVVPLLLGGGWLLSAAARPQVGRPRHAYATLSLLTLAVLSVETASFDLRFGGADVVRDRYLFYVVPLLLVASAAALTEDRRGPVAIGVALVSVGFFAAALTLEFPAFPGVSVDSIAGVLDETLIEQSGSLATATFVAITGLLLGSVVALALLYAPRLPLAIFLFAAVLVFSVLTLRTAADRVLGGTGLSGRPLAQPSGLVLDWVDSVLPDGETAAIVAFPVSTAWETSAIRWWDVEFWNRTVTRALGAPDGNFTYTPFPLRKLRIDPVTGAVAGTANAPRYVVASPGDPRFGLAGTRHAENVGLVVLDAERPYRAIWTTTGLTTDGWTRPGKAAIIRIHARPGARPEIDRVRTSLRSPSGADAAYRISTAGVARVGVIPDGESTEVVVDVCATPNAASRVTLTSSTAATMEAARLSPVAGPTRVVGVGVGPITVEPTGRACAPG
jgi:hypothetical protein